MMVDAFFFRVVPCCVFFMLGKFSGGVCLCFDARFALLPPPLSVATLSLLCLLRAGVNGVGAGVGAGAGAGATNP